MIWIGFIAVVLSMIVLAAAFDEQREKHLRHQRAATRRRRERLEEGDEARMAYYRAQFEAEQTLAGMDTPNRLSDEDMAFVKRLRQQISA